MFKSISLLIESASQESCKGLWSDFALNGGKEIIHAHDTQFPDAYIV